MHTPPGINTPAAPISVNTPTTLEINGAAGLLSLTTQTPPGIKLSMKFLQPLVFHEVLIYIYIY